MRSFAQGEDSGSLMLDGMIVMLLTIITLVSLVSFGFLQFQQWAVCSIANDTATRIAQSYAYSNADPVIGYINVDMIDAVPLWRYGKSNELAESNSRKGQKYAEWSLKKCSLAYPVSNPVIQITTVPNALSRRHVEVQIEAEYEIPFGGALSVFGLEDTQTFGATGVAECVDILNYVNSVDAYKSLTELPYGSKIIKTINKVGEMVQKIMDCWRSR